MTMSHDTSWSINEQREEHESDEQWELRRRFMERWKGDYPQERLVCLARVFANMEFMGCRYPTELMKEVAGLAEEISKSYRQSRKNMLKRTFVSASDAAEDRAKGVKRQGGVIVEGPPKKSTKINFVPQGHETSNHSEAVEISDNDKEVKIVENEDGNHEQKSIENKANDNTTSGLRDVSDYMKELSEIRCSDIRAFNEGMFCTPFGNLVLVVRPWMSKFDNIQTSCLMCKLGKATTYENNCFTLFINDVLIAQAQGFSKAEARSIVESLAWNRLIKECVIIVMKEQWIAQGDSRITTNDVSGKKANDLQFGTPIESNVAMKMMKMMGWTGGGLGADAQGIEEPVKPHLHMVNRSGLGSDTDSRRLRQAANELMRKYASSDSIDLDLVFSSDFDKEERAALHQIAKRNGLASTSYGKDQDRFLVVKKKRKDPFELVREVIRNGGVTAKYQVYIPLALSNRQY